MMLRKALCISMALLVLFCDCSVSAFAIVNESGISENNLTAYYLSSVDYGNIRSSLSEHTDVSVLREIFLDALSEAQERVDISSLKLPDTCDEELMNFIFYCMPEAFNVYKIGYLSVSSHIIELILYFRDFADTKEEYEKCFSEMKKAADELLDGIENNPYLDDVQKALLLHDRLCVHNEYVSDYTTDIDHTAYAALVNRASVCQGYTMAYMYLLDRVGIENYYCSSNKLNHAWNIVYIDSQPYHVDVTFDDYLWDKGKRGVVGALSHRNFLRSTKGLKSEAHNVSDFDSSPVSERFDNYYWQNSYSEFRLIGNEIYYIDNVNHKLMAADGNRELADIKDVWRRSDNSVWSGSYARLSSAGNLLLYSLSDGVYSYNLSDGSTEKIFSPPLKSYFSVFGFTYEDGYLICDINNEPPYGNIKNLYTVKEYYSFNVNVPCKHNSTEIHPAIPSTTESVGYTEGVYCTDCKQYVSGHEEIPRTDITFTETQYIKSDGINVYTVKGKSVYELLCQAPDASYVVYDNGDAVSVSEAAGTGMVLVLPDNSRLEIVVYGDVDGDGNVSSSDARLALRTSVGLENFGKESVYYKAANVDRTDELSASSARLILRASVGLEDATAWIK